MPRLLSHHVFKEKVFPLLDQGKVMVILIDNLRFDQWKIIEKEIVDLFRTRRRYLFVHSSYCHPVCPQCNVFWDDAGEIQMRHPGLWVDEHEEGAKNANEEELCRLQLKALGINKSFNYEKIVNQKSGKKLLENYKDLLNFDLNILVYNFVDMFPIRVQRWI